MRWKIENTRFLVCLFLLYIYKTQTTYGASSSGSLASDDRLDLNDEPIAKGCKTPFETYNSSTKVCDCKKGFSGWDCGICESSAACAAAVPSAPLCVKGFNYTSETLYKTYDCMLDPMLQTLFEDGALAVECKRERSLPSSQAIANCSAIVYKASDTTYGPRAITCSLRNCIFPEKSSNGKCDKITCKCGSSCSAITKELVEKSLSGKPAEIVGKDTQNLAIEIEGAPFPLSAKCQATSCEFDPSPSGSGSSSQGSHGGSHESFWSKYQTTILIGGGVGLILLLLLCCCCIKVATTGKKGRKSVNSIDIDAELNALKSQSGNLLTFNNLNCTIKPPSSSFFSQSSTSPAEPRVILHNVSGSAAKGCVLGILGPSGSGKTSLLNALAAVENGAFTSLTGELLIDGKRVGKDYRKLSAYVQQDDCLCSTLTVRECLLYSAELRLPSSVSYIVKSAMVDQILAELSLEHVANSFIGTNSGNLKGSRGISGGERKRVSIGMELVTSPPILFLDEPTSGLDSTSAYSVIQLVKSLAEHGRIVVLSIHQPSAKSFRLLDNILLLGSGHLLYHGRTADTLHYLDSIGYPCRPMDNLAEHLLDLAANEEAHKAFVNSRPQVSQNQVPLYRTSSSYMTSSLNRSASSSTYIVPPSNPPASSRSLRSSSASHSEAIVQIKEASSPHKRSIWIELRVLFYRTALNIFRHRALFQMHLLISIALGVCGGLIFNHVTNDLAGFQNRSGAFYFVLTFFGFASISSMDLFISERPIFLRETGAMYYSAFSYYIAKAILDTLLLRVLPATVFACIFYFIMGLQATLHQFMLFLATLIIFNIAAGSISILVSVVSSTVGTANLVGTVIFLIMLLFGGFLLNSETMPSEVKWLQHFSIFNYGFEILMTNELKGLLLTFDAPGYPAVPVYGDVFLKTLGMDYANRYYDILALGLIAGGLQCLSYLSLALQVPMRQELAGV